MPMRDRHAGRGVRLHSNKENMNTNPALEQILDGGELIAIILRASFQREGIVFFTPNDFSQQLAYMHRPAGYEIQRHVHKEVLREVKLTLEALFIRSGKVRIDFYTKDKQHLCDRIVATGDVVLLASGGHGFTMLEATQMIEVKQGPYAGDRDKERF